ncbi:MAG: putative peptidoglycan glycosyltransferase FtsW [Micavibrio sp.]
MSIFARTDQSVLGRWWWTVDRVTLTLAFVLCVLGVVLVAAAGAPVALRNGDPAHHFIIRHLIYLVPTVFAIVFLSMLSIQNVWRAALIVLACSIAAMILVLLIGVEVKGAQRWLQFGPLSLQPSELAKASFLVVTSWLLARQKEQPGFKGIYAATALFALITSLLVLQPDMGMTFVMAAGFFTVVFLAGLPFRWIAVVVIFAAGLSVLAYMGFDHVQSRVDRFINPESGDTYQIDRSLQSFRHGGVFGTGAGQGTVKNNLPDAHADFIFSVAGEELGMIITILIVGIYGFIILRGYNRIMDTDNMFVILASGGILTLFGLQALVNMGSALHLLPTKGMTLPFISYGGSSLLSSGIGMGILLALTRRQGRSGIARGGLSIRPIGGSAKA